MQRLNSERFWEFFFTSTVAVVHMDNPRPRHILTRRAHHESGGQVRMRALLAAADREPLCVVRDGKSLRSYIIVASVSKSFDFVMFPLEGVKDQA